MKRKQPKKANNMVVTQQLLNQRIAYSKRLGYGKQKWVEFCEVMIEKGYQVKLYEARRSVSKYLTVYSKAAGMNYKVRFSNHKPIHKRELKGDCDFFVGKTNLGISSTKDAIAATLEFLGSKANG